MIDLLLNPLFIVALGMIALGITFAVIAVDLVRRRKDDWMAWV